MSNTETAFEKACRIVGSAAELARQCRVSPQAVEKWSKRVPAERVRTLVAAVDAKGGGVTAHDVRPDLYPEAFVFPEQLRAPQAEPDGVLGLWWARLTQDERADLADEAGVGYTVFRDHYMVAPDERRAPDEAQFELLAAACERRGGPTRLQLRDWFGLGPEVERFPTAAPRRSTARSARALEPLSSQSEDPASLVLSAGRRAAGSGAGT